ncbi:MAG: RNA polymerase sigma factor [Chloroflexota bacterium]
MTAQTTTRTNVLSTSDEALAAEAPGRPEAFAELYERHYERVYRYHVLRTGSRQDAQDLTTQTFLAALEGVRTFRRSGSFRAWLLGIARNQAAMFYRQAYRKPAGALDEAAPDPSPPPEVLAGQRLDLERAGRAIGNLTPDQAAAINLCLFCDLSGAEAAQVMGKNEAAVKMLLLRGLKDLRRQLAQAQEETK